MDIESLQQEVTKLRNERAAYQVQSKLLESFVAMAGSSTKRGMLKDTLQKTLDVCSELTGAEKGSLFLLNNDGVVTDSILTREDTVAEERSQLIGRVLDKGLGGWVTRHRKIGLIRDTLTDDRWLTLPNQPYTVRSALAVPILRGDELLGLLTLLHSQPDCFDSKTIELMQATSNQIAFTLENAKLYTKLAESYDSLDRAKKAADAYSNALNQELEKGKQIQRDFLPKEIPHLPNWEIAVCFKPAMQVSGDFYDAFLLDDNYLGLVIADVCDKGVGSALFMALIRSLIRVFSGQLSLPAPSLTIGEDELQTATIGGPAMALKAVSLTNDYIAKEHGDDGMFATLFFGILNTQTGLLEFINGGHEAPIIFDPNGIKTRLKPTGPAVGALPHMTFNIGQALLEPGDMIFCFTDGVTEAHSPNGDFFTRNHLLSLLSHFSGSATELLARINSELSCHIMQAKQFDDITMLAIQWALKA